MKQQILFLAIFVGFSAGLAQAHSGATGIVKQRMESMKAIAAATKALAKLDWSDVEAARAGAAKNSTVLKDHAAQIIALFPKDSIHGPSEATASIWEKPEEFARIARALEAAADAFALEAGQANTAADVSAQFIAVGETCKACHAGFRKKR